jgi:hypothetical protein
LERAYCFCCVFWSLRRILTELNYGELGIPGFVGSFFAIRYFLATGEFAFLKNQRGKINFVQNLTLIIFGWKYVFVWRFLVK